MMLLVWDEPKRKANLVKHRLDFARFENGFDIAGAVRFRAAPSRTGRERFGLIGWLDDEMVVVTILSPLGTEAMAIVSMRPASIVERERYGV